MKILIRPFLLFLSLFVANAGYAQGEVPEFTVQVGNFVSPQPGDFAHLQNLGFVYSTKRPSGHTDVFLGGFTSETAAQTMATNLKAKGYENAFVSKLNTEGGQSATVIQLATKNAGEKLDWEKYHAAAPLFVLLNGNQVKIMAGGFTDLAAANAKLPELKKLGFNDAFAKNVNNALLHEVADFEMGGAIKKVLIPFDLTKEDPVIAAKKAEPKPTSYDETAGPAVAEKSQLVAKGLEPATTTAAAEKPAAKKEEAPATKKTETPPAPKAAPAAFRFKAKMPEIRANVKRTSAIELQKALKAEGTYKGPLDGFYGKGTRTAYEQALASNRQLQKYRVLATYQALPELDASANKSGTHGGFWEWEEVRLLNAIAADLGSQPTSSQLSKSRADLDQLFLNPTNQSWTERKALIEWNDKAWKGIEGWSTRDPMLAEIGSALKISYCQSQVLLEDFYMDEGFDENVSKGLALAALKALVGLHFERFL